MIMKKMFGTAILLVIAVIVTAISVNNSGAQDCRVIRIQGLASHDSIRVEPETISISKGTCVIWFNRASANEVKILFKDGKKCSDVTDSAVGFSLDSSNCFVTTWIPFGGTSSLRFMQAGSYEYQIQITAGGIDEKAKRAAKGTIVVR